MIELRLVLLTHVGQLAGLVGSGSRLLVHLLDEVICIHNGSLTGFHLALRQLDHSVGKMEYVVGPSESQLLEDQFQHLEVVVLLVADHIDVRVKVIFSETPFGRSQILGDVNRRSVRTDEQFPVKSVGREVAPDGAVRILHEHAHIQSLLNQLLTKKIGLGLVVNLVESDSESLVGLVEALEHPAVHPGPKVADLLVAGLPFLEHLVGFLEARGLLLGGLLVHSPGNQLLDFLLVDVVESHVHIPDKMVALDPRGLRSRAVADLQPCKHGLADVHSPVVDKSSLDHVVAAGLQKP